MTHYWVIEIEEDRFSRYLWTAELSESRRLTQGEVVASTLDEEQDLDIFLGKVRRALTPYWKSSRVLEAQEVK